MHDLQWSQHRASTRPHGYVVDLSDDDDGDESVANNKEDHRSNEDDSQNASFEYLFAIAAEVSLRSEQPQQQRGKKAAYVVFKGRVPGIYQTW